MKNLNTNNRMPDVSIVVPVYKVDEKLLRVCINSCINQTNDNIEIIIVDDCSCDLSAEVCDYFANKDKRISVIHKSVNQGLSAARNTGVKNSNGKWILFIDGDDWIENDTCEIINNVKEVDMIFFGMKRDYGRNSNKFFMPYENMHYFDCAGCKKLQADVLDYKKRLSTAYCKFVKREILVSNEIYHNEKVRCGVEGIEYNLRLFGAINSALFVNTYKYHYVYNESSITGAPSETTNMYSLLGIEYMEDYICKENNTILSINFNKRVQRLIYDTALGSYFNPNYKLRFQERKNKMHYFLDNKVIRRVLDIKEYYENNTVKKYIYQNIINEKYFVVWFFGFLRYCYLKIMIRG